MGERCETQQRERSSRLSCIRASRHKSLTHRISLFSVKSNSFNSHRMIYNLALTRHRASPVRNFYKSRDNFLSQKLIFYWDMPLCHFFARSLSLFPIRLLFYSLCPNNFHHCSFVVSLTVFRDGARETETEMC